MKSKKYFLLIIVIVVLFQIITVTPGLASGNEDQIFSLDEIVVIASKYSEIVLDSVASVEVITGEEIEGAQAKNLAEILSAISGLEINDYGDAGGIKSLSIRGSSAEQVLILLDGRPMNDPQTGQIDLGQIPANIIEKIEIYRGPASAVYGANALGGVINIITKKGEGESRGKIKTSIGTYQTQDYEITYQGSSKDLNYLIFGKYFTTEGSRENSQMNEVNLLGKMNLSLDQQTSMDLTLQYNSYQRGVPGSLTYLSPKAVQDEITSIDCMKNKGFYHFGDMSCITLEMYTTHQDIDHIPIYENDMIQVTIKGKKKIGRVLFKIYGGVGVMIGSVFYTDNIDWSKAAIVGNYHFYKENKNCEKKEIIRLITNEVKDMKSEDAIELICEIKEDLQLLLEGIVDE